MDPQSEAAAAAKENIVLTFRLSLPTGTKQRYRVVTVDGRVVAKRGYAHFCTASSSQCHRPAKNMTDDNKSK